MRTEVISIETDCLACYRRGHAVLSNRDSRDLDGGAFQTIKQLGLPWSNGRSVAVSLACGARRRVAGAEWDRNGR